LILACIPIRAALAVCSGASATLPELAGAQLKREIQTGGCCADLHFAPQMIKAEHVGFNCPRAGRHSLQLEFAFFAGHGG
jgi:hypothetical protein